MTSYAALDVSLRSVAICIIDDQGEVCLERTVPSEVTNIVACLMDFDHRVDVVGFEAGTLTQYLAHGLQSDGFDVICLEARRVDAALSAMRNKTDRNDARGIAQILRTGWYSRVHVKSLASHYVRALLSSRKAVLKKCIDLENEVCSRCLGSSFRHRLAMARSMPGSGRRLKRTWPRRCCLCSTRGWSFSAPISSWTVV